MKIDCSSWNSGFSLLAVLGPTVIWEKPFKDEVLSIPFFFAFFLFGMLLVPFLGPQVPNRRKEERKRFFF